ncbi:hypothetical protein MMC26_000129 [Xylographa opegraphella]|nr:hypothetical protein [Xylographa opegraphella]
MPARISQFLLPRGEVYARSSNLASAQIRSRPPPQQRLCKYASTASSPPKPRVLEKPAKFNPPSHPARRNRPPPRQFPGPPLSESEVDAQRTKQYPNMLPPEGSFMRWFLTSRSIHIWITLSTLSSLALFTFTTNFRQTSPYANLLPPSNAFFSHPLDFLAQYIEVYKMHTAHISAVTAERRKKKVEDVQKRAQYRKAHGLDQGEGLGQWTAKADEEMLGPSLKTDRAVEVDPSAGSGTGLGKAEDTKLAQDNVFVDWEGRKLPIKKWFGIW